MCTLRVFGSGFDVPAALSGSSLPAPAAIHVPGHPAYDRRHAGRGEARRGVNLTVSSRQWTDLRGQVADAVAWLRRHESALRELTARDDVDVAELDFPIDAAETHGRVIVAGGVFPLELVQLCAALGIQLAFTVYADGEGA